MKRYACATLIFGAYCAVTSPGNASDPSILGVWGDDLRCFGYHRPEPAFAPIRVSTEYWSENRGEAGTFQCRYTSFEHIGSKTWTGKQSCKGGLFGLRATTERRIELLDADHITIRTGDKIYWSAETALPDTVEPETRIENTKPETYVGLRRCDQSDVKASIAHHFPPGAIEWNPQSRTAQAIYLLRYAEQAAKYCKFDISQDIRKGIVERITSGLNKAFTMETVMEIQGWSKDDHDSDKPYSFFCQTLYNRIGPKGSVMPNLLRSSRDYDTY